MRNGSNFLSQLKLCRKLRGGSKLPRGNPKTREERLKEAEIDKEWRSRQSPLKSPCLKDRRRHYFGQFNDDPDKKCGWCGKTRRQVKAEQR